MGTSIDSSTALLTEHLSYTPLSLIDDVINIVNELGNKAVDTLEQGLLDASPSSLGFSAPPDLTDAEAAVLDKKVKDEIEGGVHKFETLLEATLDKVFDKFEIVALRNTWKTDGLEDWLRLRHYEGLNFDLPSDAPTVESVMQQRAKLQESQRLNRLLTSEVAKNAALIAELRALRYGDAPPKRDAEAATDAPGIYPVFGFLENSGSLADGAGQEPLKTTVDFALSQSPALQELLAKLRPPMRELAKAPAPGDPNVVEDGAAKSRRRERLEYIESQTRKHLANVDGMELGRQGEVIDGEWQGAGKRPGKGEVADLERVVGMIGGTASSTRTEMDEGP